ncbi:hypothetical protein B296_00050451 [Ensete ventricosum]|uniref:Uncharacterized protein n=1 Tax=Ensete ventricosum TaxID=4639 RepID=A0A426YDE5_ENSVE|nr:hypothetical protein B296_00050451 [Ensete ventricosum]
MSARATKLTADRASKVEVSEYDTAQLLHAPLMSHGAPRPRPIPLHPHVHRTTRSCPEGRQGIISSETTRGTTRPTPKRKPLRRSQPRSKVQISNDVGELTYSYENRSGRHLSSTPKSSIRILTLEGGSMSQERPTGNPNSEHPDGSTHVLPSTLQPTGQTRFLAKEASTVLPTPNRSWRLFNDSGLTLPDPGLTPPPPSLGPPVVTAKAFVGLAQQVQILTGMIQAIVPYIPQLAQAPMHQRLDVPRHTLQQEAPQSRPTQGEHHDSGAPHHPPIKATIENPNASVSQSANRSQDVMCIPLEPDVVSSYSTNSVREPLRQVNQRLDEVQRDFIRSKEEVGETTKGGSHLLPRFWTNLSPPAFSYRP